MTSIKLSESDSGKLVSVVDLPGDVLIIPQATLGGKTKGKVMQYHNNINKDEGLTLYQDFVSKIESLMAGQEKCIVQYGTYGKRQVFECVTNGPYTHLLEL